MRLSVKTGSAEEYSRSADLPACSVSGYKEYYTALLQNASDEKKELLSLKGLPLNEKPSADFQSMGIMEQTILSFLTDHEYPQKVQIICDSEECATRYKVIYNFYYASDKSSRMDDKTWD